MCKGQLLHTVLLFFYLKVSASFCLVRLRCPKKPSGALHNSLGFSTAAPTTPSLHPPPAAVGLVTNSTARHLPAGMCESKNGRRTKAFLHPNCPAWSELCSGRKKGLLHNSTVRHKFIGGCCHSQLVAIQSPDGFCLVFHIGGLHIEFLWMYRPKKSAPYQRRRLIGRFV